jgi:hypothetical protein
MLDDDDDFSHLKIDLVSNLLMWSMVVVSVILIMLTIHKML